MKGRVNMKDVREQGTFELVGEGEHQAMIQEIRDQYSKENKDPMTSIKLRILGGPSEGLWVWDNILIPNEGSPAMKIMGRTKHFLHCIGEPHEGEIEWNSERWINKTVKIKVTHEPANSYHRFVKAIVTQYILGDEAQADSPDEPF